MKNVSIEEQRNMGLRRENYSAAPIAVKANTEFRRQPAQPLAQSAIVLDVTPTAVTSVEMKTSAVDRAKGFLIGSVPRTFAFSFSVAMAALVLTDISFAVDLVLLFSVFSVVELVSYVFTLNISAEGTAHMEARNKWQVIKEEQRQRWQHYRSNGGQ